MLHQYSRLEAPSDLTLTELLGFLTDFRRAFPDLHDIIEMQLAEGDLVATRVTTAGTQEGEYQGIPPTGRRLAWGAMMIDRIEDGRIVESWGNWDMLGMLEQMGAAVVPPRS